MTAVAYKMQDDIKCDKFKLMEISKEVEQWTKEKVEVMP
jgi:hypothetical protein